MDHRMPENIPEGFEYYPDFLSEQEENDLLNIISAYELETFVFQGYTAKRKVASFGFNYSFDNRKLSEVRPVSEEFRFLIAKAAEAVHLSPNA
jgi:hypothetical protein